MTTPTNNNIPSNSVQDRLYNAEKFDEFMNSDNPNYTDRKGVSRWTLSGIRQAIQNWMDSLGSSSGASNVGTAQNITLQEGLNHLLTTGTVLRFRDFGVKGDGTDETDKIITAINKASLTGSKLVADYGSKFKISGSGSINCYYSIDWNNSVIDIDDFTGKINLLRPSSLAPRILSNDSPEIQAIRDKGQTIWGGVINAWATNTSLANYYICINTTVDAFEYRNVKYKQKARNRLYRGGILEKSTDYPIDPQTIDTIELYPVPDTTTEFKNVIFKKTSDPRDLLYVEHSKIKISGIRFLHGGSTVSTGMIWLNSSNCFDMEWGDIESPYGQKFLSNPSDPGSVLASYTFRIADSYNCYLHDIRSNGGEWGTIGTDEVTNCLVERCTLSRYDSHRPFHGSLTIQNSVIGMRGLSIQGAGEKVLLDNVTFMDNSINEFTPNFGLPRIIDTRGDAGGFCDAELIVRNCTIVNNLDQTIHLVAQGWGPQYSSGLPAGSPYKNVTFRSIKVIDPTILTLPGSVNSCVDFGIREVTIGTITGYTATGSNTPDLPFDIILRGVRSKEGSLSSLTILNTRPASDARKTNITSSTTDPYSMATNLNLVIDDCVLTDKGIPVTSVDTTDTYSIRVNFNGFKSMSDAQSVSMRVFMPALISGFGSRLREIRPFYNNTSLTKPLGVTLSSCDIYTPDSFISWDLTYANKHANLSGCNIQGDTLAILAKMAAYKLTGCKYFQTGVGRVEVPITQSLSGDTANFVNVSWLSTENVYRIELDQGSWPIILPQPTKAIYMDLGFSEDGVTPKRMKIYRSSGTGGALGLTKFNNPLPTYIYLP